MIALAIVLTILVLIALVPVGVQLQYDDGALLLRVMAGKLGIQLYPKKEKQFNARRRAAKMRRKAARTLRKQRQQEKRQARETHKRKKKPMASTKPLSPQKRSMGDIWQLIGLGKELLGDMRRKLLVRRLRLRVLFGGEDAARSAILYGQAWAVIGAVMPALETLFRIQDRDVEAEFDPTKSKMELSAQLDLRMRIGAMVALGCKAGFRFLNLLIKQKKGGAET